MDNSPLRRKADLNSKWSEVKPEQRKTKETIFSRPAPPQLLTQSISMEDLTQQDVSPPTTSLYDQSVTPEKKYNQPLTVVPGGTNSLFNTPGEPVAQDGWVTVFGFPNGSMSVVLAHFKTFGPVTRYEEGRGNWVDVCFASKWAAQKALSKNGTMLPGTSIMVGVVPRQSTVDASSLTSPKKKTQASGSIITGSTNANNGSIFNQNTQQQEQQPSFPIRLFKFIMGW